MFRPYRRAVQFAFFALMFIIPVLNLYEIYAVTGTYYAVNMGGFGMADPSAILQTVSAAGQLGLPLLNSLLFPALLALVLGRVWCGWMCPYHVLSDGAARVRSMFRTKVMGKSEPEALVVPSAFKANVFRYAFLLVGTAAAAAIGAPILNYLNAPGVLSTEAMILVRERAVSVEFGFIVLIVGLEVFFFPRFWCRLFCPTGACLSLIRAPFRLRVQAKTKDRKGPCCKESVCASVCPMGLAPYREGADLLCTNCARCIDACRGGKKVGLLGFAGFLRARPEQGVMKGARRIVFPGIWAPGTPRKC